MATIANGTLKFEPMINKSKEKNFAFFTVITFSNIIYLRIATLS